MLPIIIVQKTQGCLPQSMNNEFFSSSSYLLRLPLSFLKGVAGAYLAYPLAEYLEKRSIRPKIAQLQQHYSLPFATRRRIALDRLAEILEFSGQAVPYYKDLFKSVGFDPSNVRKDPLYLQELPYLTKDIIREQGARMFSRPIENALDHLRKTGGSTGLSCMIYYDQEGLDYSSAVVRYSRNRAGKSYHQSELHFACRFPDMIPRKR